MSKELTGDDLKAFSAPFMRAADWVAQADGLLITAGAGMGVDSGLPDFRGTQGFWQAYPALGRSRIAFKEIANPASFQHDPRLAWGFYGHRLALYRQTLPHPGFAILQKWVARMPDGGFVFTSNVDGQFQKAGFDPDAVCEVHGSIHHLQCCQPCSQDIWPADAFLPEVDEGNCRLVGDFPRCPCCGGLARPNILMFGDAAWVGRRSEAQQLRLNLWRQRLERLLVVELGAGLAVPTVRWFGESLGVPMVRINPDAPACDLSRSVGLPLGAHAALATIDDLLDQRG